MRAWLAAACAGLVLAGPATASAATVTVVAPTGHQTPVALDPLLANADVRDRAYVVRSERGAATRTVTGVSLAAVLQAADAQVDQFRYAEVQNGAGAAVLFSHDQALDGDWGDTGPPVFFAGPDGLGFLRPSMGGDDLNGADELRAPDALTIRLRQKIRLTVSATASPRRPDVGEEVSFSATVGGAGAGEAVEISWLFGDGRRGAGADVTHTYRKAGTFRALATVTTGSDPVGASAIVTVKVGAGPEEAKSASVEDRSSASGDAGGSEGAGGATGTGGLGGTDDEPGAPSEAGAVARPTRASSPSRSRERRRPDRPRRKPAGGELSGQTIETVGAVEPVAHRVTTARGPERDHAATVLSPAAWTALGIAAALTAGWHLEQRRWRRRLVRRGTREEVIA